MLTEIQFASEPDLGTDEFIDVLIRSSLAERRPIHDQVIIEQMLRRCDLLLTARKGGLLVGVARSLSDFSYCTYLSDLAVDQAFQKRGIGRELIRLTHATAGLHTSLILLSAPAAVNYYPHIGMTQHHSCWTLPRTPQT